MKVIAIVILSIFLSSCAAERIQVKHSVGTNLAQEQEDAKKGLIKKRYFGDLSTQALISEIRDLLSKDGRVEVDIENRIVYIVDTPEVHWKIINHLYE